MEVARITGKCDFRQRTTVCSRDDKGVEQNVGDRNKAILSPRNRWTNRENKLRAGAIFENVCKL